MMLYTGRRVKKLTARLQQECNAALEQQQREIERIKAENRTLKARNLELEGDRQRVADALVYALRAGDRASEEYRRERETEDRQLKLLAVKCALLASKLQEKYPDHEDIAEFERYTEELRRLLGMEEAEETGFNMDDVIAPKEPLDLGKLCRELGLMEENS